jgi:hypothetical protein
MKREGYVIPELEKYLSSLPATDDDRAQNVNSPSQAGNCLRAGFYSRIKAMRDSSTIEGRLRRIFDNGTAVHERLQAYMLECGLLAMIEVPLYNKKYNIQGHTDGILNLSPSERGVLEIKSINSNGFAQLHDAKPEHKDQALSYLFCLEEQRKALHRKYKTREAFDASVNVRKQVYKKRYSYMRAGRRFTRTQKIAFQVGLCMQLDEILWETDAPITTIVFLYENKDDQNLKEFSLSLDDPEAQGRLETLLNDFALLNACVEAGTPPKREGTSKSSDFCRWCNFRFECWG